MIKPRLSDVSVPQIGQTATRHCEKISGLGPPATRKKEENALGLLRSALLIIPDGA